MNKLTKFLTKAAYLTFWAANLLYLFIAFTTKDTVLSQHAIQMSLMTFIVIKLYEQENKTQTSNT